MNCQHYRNIMFDYFETELSSKERDDINQHLQACEFCRRQYELTRLENQILQDTGDIPEIDDAFNHKVMNMIKAGAVNNQEISARKKPRYRWLPAYSKAAAAAVLLLACLSVPAILPQFQDNGVLEQAGLVEKSDPLTAGDVTGNNTKSLMKEMDGERNLAQLNDSANLEVPLVLKNDPVVNNTPSSALPQSEADGVRLQSIPVGGKTEMQTYGQVDQSETSRALKFGLRFVAPSADKPILYNTPSNFALKETKHVCENQVQYSYEDPDTQQNFMVNIAPVEPDAGKAAADDQSALKAKEPKTIEMENLASFQNQSKRIIEHNGLKYQIIITSSMEKEELDRITEAISLTPLSNE